MSFPTVSYKDADGSHRFLLDRDITSMGRFPGQDIVLTDQRVSREHALIVREDGSYFVVDRNSSHGTFLNGVRVQRVLLKSGDRLQLGSLEGPRLHFHFGLSHELEPSGAPSMVSTLLSSMNEFPRPGRKSPAAAREMEQLTWLLTAARQLNAVGAIRDILATLLQLTLQLTGVERGFVFLRENGEMKLASGLNAQGLPLREESAISRRAIQKAIESDATFYVGDTQAGDLASAWESVAANKIRSIYCIPLRKRDALGGHAELLGLLYLDSRLDAGYLSEVDHQLLDTIATEAAALLQNALLAEADHKARRTREELALAARIHSGLMSISLPVIPYAELQAKSIPCYEIGGDFFDAVELVDCVCVAIADVSGKGVPAAIVAATMQGIIHAQLRSGQSLPDIAGLLNRFLCARNVGKYATMVLFRLFPDGRAEFINCGHIHPLLVHRSGVEWLDESNPVVGLLPDAAYCSARFTLQPGERILLVTDGLLEAENSAGEAFGEDRMIVIAQHLNLDAILEHVVEFQAPNEAQDDCTLVELRYRGAPE